MPQKYFILFYLFFSGDKHSMTSTKRVQTKYTQSMQRSGRQELKREKKGGKTLTKYPSSGIMVLVSTQKEKEKR